jgi:hypothetical protein
MSAGVISAPASPEKSGWYGDELLEDSFSAGDGYLDDYGW